MRRLPWQSIERRGAGQRDRRVRFERKVTTSTDFPVVTWDFAFDALANRFDVEADERFAAAQESLTGYTRWECGYRAAIDPERVDVPDQFRVVYEGHIYNIVAAFPIGRKRAVEVITTRAGKVAAA